MRVAVLGAGIQGVACALELAWRGCAVTLYERDSMPLGGASLWNEGKIHLGLIFANDTSLRTARTLMAGALSFTLFANRLFSPNELACAISDPFIYAVHRQSLLDTDAVERHFTRVSDLFAEMADGRGEGYFGYRSRRLAEPLRNGECESHFDGARVKAGFRSREIALDTSLLAFRLREAIASERLIDFRPNHKVNRVARDDAGSFEVHTEGDDRNGERYDHIVNALWEDRLRVDASMGLHPTRPWLFRYKLALHVTGAEGTLPRSTTLMLGPFGDIVNFGGGRLYLSWYPACCLEKSRDLSPPVGWRNAHSEDRKRLVYEQSLEALADIVPAVRGMNLQGARVDIAGGPIFAWGDTDIIDPRSELHKRFGIVSRGNYHSIDTGKFSMAPHFAAALAERLRPGDRLKP